MARKTPSVPRTLAAIATTAALISACKPRDPASSGLAAGGGAGRSALTWTRAAVGKPMTDDERREATRVYIDMLEKTRYYEVLNERTHGWPASDSRHPWWGIWWIGVQIQKTAQGIAFKHHKIGSDNAASDTAMMLENTCYAQRLWGLAPAGKALHKLMRGMGAQVKAMASASRPRDPVMVARSFYPESVVSRDDGRNIPFLYDDARPGEDNDATVYVHIPDNPTWGDVYVKNKRSKDDMGHVLRAMAQVDASCAHAGALDSAMASDWSEALGLYVSWAARVEADNWRIATRGKDMAVVYPRDTLANFYRVAECNAMAALGLFGRGVGRDCGDGVGGVVDWAATLNDQNLGILESFHQAAVIAALQRNKDDAARASMRGLVTRMEKHLDAARKGKLSKDYPAEKLAGFMLRNAAMGIPLGDGEARWLQQQIKVAHDTYLEARRDHQYDIEKASLPDGLYPYNPYGVGLQWRDIGAVAGLCASEYVNPTGVAVLDCAMLKAHAWGQ